MCARQHCQRSALIAAGTLVAWAASIGCVGCARSSSQSQEASKAGDPAETPRETLVRLIAAREAHAYRDMRALILSQQAEQVITYLMAADDFLLANREICEYVRDQVGLGLAQSIDQSHLAANLEIFSPYVELLDEVVEGDVAVVSFVVDNSLPVKRAELRRIGDTWRYNPGPGYAPELPKAFHRMARGLRQALQEIKSGRLSPEKLRNDPDLLVKEVEIRLLPGVKMLRRPDPTSGGGD
jgi:hypothetical protein